MKENKELIFDIYEKVCGKSDLDWVEIRDKHDLDCHIDTLRKSGAGIKLASEAGCLNFEKASTDAYAEVYKAKKQFYDQRREYNKLLTEEARWSHIEEELIRCANALNEKKAFVPAPPVHIYGESREAILVLSDWHFGLTTDNIWNQYNIEIADRRIQKLINEVSLKIQENNIGKLHVLLLGDIVSGEIHTSIRVANSENVVDQLMMVSERIAELVAQLSDLVEFVEIHSTWGNHARVTASYKDAIHDSNLERLIPFWLEQRFKDRDDVYVDHDNAHELVSITSLGHNICATHGDLDNSKTNPMMTLPVLYEKNFGRKAKIIITAHLHHVFCNEVMDVIHVGVGALCGADEYAKDKRLFSKPSQTLLIIDNDGLDAIHNIDLSRA